MYSSSFFGNSYLVYTTVMGELVPFIKQGYKEKDRKRQRKTGKTKKGRKRQRKTEKERDKKIYPV